VEEMSDGRHVEEILRHRLVAQPTMREVLVQSRGGALSCAVGGVGRRPRPVAWAPVAALCPVQREGAGEVLVRSRGGAPSNAVGGVGWRPRPAPWAPTAALRLLQREGAGVTGRSPSSFRVGMRAVAGRDDAGRI
jgi:DNA-binding protein